MPPDVFAWNTLYFRPGGDRNNHAYVDSHTLTLASSSNPVSQQPRTSRAGATSNHHCQRSEQSHIFSVLYGRFGSFYVCSEPEFGGQRCETCNRAALSGTSYTLGRAGIPTTTSSQRAITTAKQQALEAQEAKKEAGAQAAAAKQAATTKALGEQEAKQEASRRLLDMQSGGCWTCSA